MKSSIIAVLALAAVTVSAQLPVPVVGTQVQWSPVGNPAVLLRAAVITKVLDYTTLAVELMEFPLPGEHFGYFTTGQAIPAVQGPTLTDFDTAHFDPVHPVFYMQMHKDFIKLTPAGDIVVDAPPAPPMPEGVPTELHQWVTTAIPWCGNAHIGACWTGM